MATRITLTFDNGPDEVGTPRLLDVLRAWGITATFFVVAERLREPRLRALAERTRAEGHAIGNHTLTHTVRFGDRLDDATTAREIDDAQALLGTLSDERRLFRPFGGGGELNDRLFNRAAIRRLVAGRYTCVLWNVVPRDWSDAEGWVDRGLDQCAAHPWSVVVLHDTAPACVASLDRFIAGLVRRSIEFTPEFAPDCMPIVRGKVLTPLGSYVNDTGTSRVKEDGYGYETQIHR